MISMDKKYRTRDGREVRIYAVDGDGSHPVHGAIKINTGWRSCTWEQEGFHLVDEGYCDLIEVKPRIQRTDCIEVSLHEAGVEIERLRALSAEYLNLAERHMHEKHDALDEIERLREALTSAASWIDRWCCHVGNCSGSDRTCTCGKSALAFETSAALAPT